jgi:acyl-CoA thioesterase
MSAPVADERCDAECLARQVVQAMYERDLASQALGMRVEEVGPGYARVSMSVRDDMVNGHRICHGGLIFALADSAFAFACNTGNRVTVAAGATIDFLRPGELGDVLTATARERSRTRRNGIYDVEVCKQTGECVALFRGRSHERPGEVIQAQAAPPALPSNVPDGQARE